jgi:ABC-type polysaccharide/polyol phosphate transport system ATPase subunit
MTNVDLKFDRVSKVYRVAHQDGPSALGIGRLRRSRRRIEDFWAVRDLSFEVKRGEVVGIIGHNGAGKSTVLKLLSNITSPTTGEITIRGHLSALIEVGSGFHPELTGRENIFLSGAILGMRRREIAAKLDSIVEFAELSDFIDTPVKRYSSGMYVRLGFSIAAHLDPDILLLDEVLAVGDARFQGKCLDRIDDLRRAGKTIVFISHDLSAVARLCSRVLLMEHGQMRASGPPSEVIDAYARTAAAYRAPTLPHAAANASREAQITSFTIHRSDGHEGEPLRTGDAFIARVGYSATMDVPNAVFVLFINGEDGELACHFTTESGDDRIDIRTGAGQLEFSCAELGLKPGIYSVDLTIEQYPKMIDWQVRCATFRVDAGKTVRGRFYMPSRWALLKNGELSNQVSSFGVESKI